ncbi:alpha/beta-Hydrolases superfamily protein [Perilla frutescens var. hirtella]|uniref:Alpha/beta-Hydrolases superfamily protein n=1 Tax=Perilla frutescens var. hirtella TaxID=608512 RepID=A0AAD4J6I4_PERFH|nr:alpha/beta-Hydrolases superfamily protein [Perilla frutescens var. hirtella]
MASSFSSFLLLLLFLFPIAIAASVRTYFPAGILQSSLKKSGKNLKPKIPYEAHYFPQNLDHFTFQPKSYQIFYQKYLINRHYWKKGSPIFVYTGNEGDIDWFAANTGFLLDIAPKFHALLVFIEHRFYGESLPFGKHSYKSAKTLGYLNSQQALADYALLIRSLKHNLSCEASPVVVFGGSYGGMLAAWFRLKYPHIAIGALASSAPILQFDDITPWSSFYDGVSQDFKDASLNCYEVIKGSWEELEAFETNKEGLVELSRSFRACKTVQSIYSARNWLWEAFVYTAMVNYPTEANFMKPLPAYPVKEMCKIIDGSSAQASKLSRVLAAASLYYNYSKSEKCFELEHPTDDHGLHGWDWQACTEMVMPTVVSNESMFPPYAFSYKDYADDCMKNYGVRPRPHWITTEFGGTNIERVLKRFGSNIIFSSGLQDPWSRGSVLKNISASIVALVAEKALCVCGPALYFKFKKGLKLQGVSASTSCPPCICSCAPPQSLFKIVPGLANLSVTDCGKDDPDLKEEMEKQFVDLLSEEIKLEETVGEEHSHHMNITLGEAKRLASQYQREAEKCIATTETCEGARERAVVLLSKEKKLTLLWERRARQVGWEG